MLTFNLTAGKLVRVDSYKTATESSLYPECLFNLYDDWNGATVTARFSTESGTAYDVLLVDGKCTVPYEVMALDHFYVSCKGALSSVVVTSNRVRIDNDYSAFELTPSNPGTQTPDVISQLTSQISGEATARSNADTALTNKITAVRNAIMSIAEASSASAMTDTSKFYVYTGSETGYTNGDWYYYDGSDWVSGGAYNAITVATLPSDALIVDQVSLDNFSVSADSPAETTISASKTGYTPVGVVGWRITNATTSGTRADYLRAYVLSLSGTTLDVGVRNGSSSAAKVKITVDILYRKNY